MPFLWSDSLTKKLKKLCENSRDREDFKSRISHDKVLQEKGFDACERKADREGWLEKIPYEKLWPEELEKKLEKLCMQCQSFVQLQEMVMADEELKERNWDACRVKAKRKGWLENYHLEKKEDDSRGNKKKLAPKKNTENLFDFLRSGKTIAELMKQFKRSELEVKKLLTNAPAGQDVYVDRTLPGIDRYFCIPEIKLNGQERIWRYVLEISGGPAADIIFPDDIGWKKEKIGGEEDRKLEKMRIVPLADIWYGHLLCDEAGFKERLNWIAQEPHVFCFLNGDCIYPMTVKDDNEDDLDHWDYVCEQFYDLIKPITHKILWAQAGCFEDKMAIHHLDPIQTFCRKEEVDIPYFRTPVSIGIHWAGNLFKFYCIHGRSQAQKKGSKINALLKILSETCFNHFFVMSHIKDSIAAKPTRVIEDVVDFNLKETAQYALITPSFVKYDGSRDSKWGYPLPSRGQINCALYRNGDHFLYSSSPTTNLAPFDEGGEA